MMVNRSVLSGWASIFLAAWLAGCSSAIAPLDDPQATSLLRDDLYPSHHLFAVESPEDIFSLDESAQDFARRSQSVHHTVRDNIQNLVKQIFDHTELGLTYQNNANTIASETFANGTANCLSLSIMTYAMAQYVGLSPQFYEVNIPEYWTRREGANLLNGHINMRINPPRDLQDIVFSSAYSDVDFDPQEMRNGFRRDPIPKQRVVAMYYNNLGADALLANSYSKAYSYFKAALTSDESLGEAWVNLGVLYRRGGHDAAAEQSYLRALQENEEHLTAWENLAILYKNTGRMEQGEAILTRVVAMRDANPFYHLMLGEEALDNGQPEAALDHYKTALRRDRNQHEVYFGMAKAYVEIGDYVKAEFALNRAAALAPGEGRKRYQSKILALHAGQQAGYQ